MSALADSVTERSRVFAARALFASVAGK